MGKQFSTSVTIKIALVILYFIIISSVIALILQGHEVPLLNPQGIIADQEHQLMLIATLLMLIVVIPVFGLTFGIAWKYRASNTKARHAPDWDHSRVLETMWWLFPCAIIAVLGVITWVSSHQLDPYKPLVSTKPPINIQVVALDWKWLFIYPAQGIATVNQVEFPQKTPVNFEITSDAPMNSFWIPALGGQIYAMSGMTTQLHLMADGLGSYNGSSANISGVGFAGMKFVATSTTGTDFNNWVETVKHSPNYLDATTYTHLSAPSQNNPPTDYVLSDPSLYDSIIVKYMGPQPNGSMQGMGM